MRGNISNPTMFYQDRAKVLANDQVVPRCYLMGIESPEIGARFQPGQFVMVRLRDRFTPLLARPFSIHDALPGDEGSVRGIKLLYKVYGDATRLLAELKPGDEVALWGPLGKGFNIPRNCQQFVMLAGGIGAAPFVALAKRICDVTGGAEDGRLTYMVGARSGSELLLASEMEKLGAEVIVATEDGSLGTKGLITDVFARQLEAGKVSSNTIVYACGPEGMLECTARLSIAYGLRCEMSLESMMACGFGACYGCARRMKDAEGEGWHYELVCKEGPVFPAEKVLFDTGSEP